MAVRSKRGCRDLRPRVGLRSTPILTREIGKINKHLCLCLCLYFGLCLFSAPLKHTCLYLCLYSALLRDPCHYLCLCLYLFLYLRLCLCLCFSSAISKDPCLYFCLSLYLRLSLSLSLSALLKHFAQDLGLPVTFFFLCQSERRGNLIGINAILNTALSLLIFFLLLLFFFFSFGQRPRI